MKALLASTYNNNTCISIIAWYIMCALRHDKIQMPPLLSLWSKFVLCWTNIGRVKSQYTSPGCRKNVHYATTISSSNSGNFWLCALWSDKCARCRINMWCAVCSVHCLEISGEVQMQVKVQVQCVVCSVQCDDLAVGHWTLDLIFTTIHLQLSFH